MFHLDHAYSVLVFSVQQSAAQMELLQQSKASTEDADDRDFREIFGGVEIDAAAARREVYGSNPYSQRAWPAIFLHCPVHVPKGRIIMMAPR
ncbi:hypothetical protein EJ03DRAFT_327923 [Teratosphaeria nubilosa]|uniref:Uncharacterized protein n=1 Tax=Teratosphaeria nubilosa TaxID=161662 RepID=A0A6G1L8P1_9PEZI|nr:hypothetical protein EJ03DRAFT_327923 [Teratosphaeria nubilosa]